MVGSRLGKPAGEHVAVAGGLDLFEPCRAARSSNRQKMSPRTDTVSSAERRAASEVKSTRSENRMVASGIRSAITVSPRRMRSTIDPGRMLRSSASERSFSARSSSRSRFFSREAPMRARSTTGLNGLGK
jgi:hypothetical protein